MSALRNRGFQAYLSTYMLAMMADNIEHVISYWFMFQKFHSPALGGFAVVSHWVPFILFAAPVGALNDKFDTRRIVQGGMLLFIAASLGWAYFFVTDTLTFGAAVGLLVLHGCAGVLWGSSQVMLHEIVGQDALPSAVRLNATGRYLALLAGPAVGGVVMLWLGPIWGICVNTVFYLPLVLWLVNAPYGRNKTPRGPVRVRDTAKQVATMPVVQSMMLLAGGASFFVGNSYHAQMPSFAQDLGHGDPGTAYSALLGADAAGALLAGLALELRGFKASPKVAIGLAMGWGTALAGFALSGHYGLALVLLFFAGFFELSFSSMAQSLVQLNAPSESRGRILGLYAMSALGLRAFSGITVGVLGSAVGVHVSLALSAVAFTVLCTYFAQRFHSAGTRPR